MRYLILLLILTIFIPSSTIAEDFLGIPVIPMSEIVLKSDGRLEMKTGLSHNKTLSFYREALKAYPDIKFREWKDSTYIEDDGKLAWHSITISKGDTQKTAVTIVKDNWTWIIGTLVLRYMGVFAVLIILFLGMTVSGVIISKSARKMKVKKRGA